MSCICRSGNSMVPGPGFLDLGVKSLFSGQIGLGGGWDPPKHDFSRFYGQIGHKCILEHPFFFGGGQIDRFGGVPKWGGLGGGSGTPKMSLFSRRVLV